MGLILSEPIKKVVEILKILTKMSVEDAKNHPKRPYRPRTSSGRKGRKKTKKIHRRQTAEQKTRTRGNPVVFPCLGGKAAGKGPPKQIEDPRGRAGIDRPEAKKVAGPNICSDIF